MFLSHDSPSPAVLFRHASSPIDTSFTQCLDWPDKVAVTRIRYRNANLNVSDCDAVTFLAYSGVANEATLALVLISDNPNTPDEDNLR